MIYHSTRDEKLTAAPTRAVLEGIAPDGGLYVCDPGKLDFDWQGTLQKDTMSMAADILGVLLPDFQDMNELVRASYAGKFASDDLTPLVPVGERYVLELYHGPTSAFKDVALSVLPRLVSAAAKQEGAGDVVILTATSGDTGKAALEGFHDVPGTRIMVFYPAGGVSPVQEAQMVTQEGGNVRVCAIRGNFDDAQTGVKNVFAACKGKDLHGAVLSSANSINIGRLAPQVVYYFRAYADLVQAGRIRVGEKVHFVVPTGNFGDILAGYFAKRMGLPVGRLVCASNANDVLTEFISTGVYDRRRPFYKTTSPSMDILVSSNLERLLFDLSGENDAEVKGYMDALAKTGKYEVSDAIKAALADQFWGGFCGEAGTSAAIAKYYKENGYLIDTHTAVAFRVAETRRTDAPMVVLSTASPFKFPRDVLTALGVEAPASDFAAMAALTAETGAEAPASLRELDKLEVRFKTVLQPADIRTAALR
mgnify:CR=1 FL=1